MPAQPLRDFGLVMKMGPITAVQADSPAADAGLKAGDVIETVDGKAVPTRAARTAGRPMTLPDYLRNAAQRRTRRSSCGRRRGDRAMPESNETVTLRLTPRVADRIHSARAGRCAAWRAERVGIAYRHRERSGRA